MTPHWLALLFVLLPADQDVARVDTGLGQSRKPQADCLGAWCPEPQVDQLIFASRSSSQKQG